MAQAWLPSLFEIRPRSALRPNAGIRSDSSPADRGHIHIATLAAPLMLQQTDRPVIRLRDLLQQCPIRGIHMLGLEPKGL
jgi:hypothetical protein